MPTHVYANNNEVASKAADGKSIAAFPDVCFSPPAPPVGPMPLPYPNTGEVKDTDSGTAKVFVKDKMSGMGDDSYMTKSMGDEPATKNFNKGMITSALQGKCYFGLWSMDVQMEGKGVPRHLDMVTHNHASMMCETNGVLRQAFDPDARGGGGYPSQKSQTADCVYSFIFIDEDDYKIDSVSEYVTKSPDKGDVFISDSKNKTYDEKDIGNGVFRVSGKSDRILVLINNFPRKVKSSYTKVSLTDKMCYDIECTKQNVFNIVGVPGCVNYVVFRIIRRWCLVFISGAGESFPFYSGYFDSSLKGPVQNLFSEYMATVDSRYVEGYLFRHDGGTKYSFNSVMLIDKIGCALFHTLISSQDNIIDIIVNAYNKGMYVAVIGHSWGGDTALHEVAEKMPNKATKYIRLLATLDPVGRIDGPPSVKPSTVEYYVNVHVTYDDFKKQVAKEQNRQIEEYKSKFSKNLLGQFAFAKSLGNFMISKKINSVIEHTDNYIAMGGNYWGKVPCADANFSIPKSSPTQPYTHAQARRMFFDYIKDKLELAGFKH